MPCPSGVAAEHKGEPKRGNILPYLERHASSPGLMFQYTTSSAFVLISSPHKIFFRAAGLFCFGEKHFLNIILEVKGNRL